MRTQQLGPGTPKGLVSAVAPPTSPRDGVPVVSRNATGSTLGPLRIRLGPDTLTTEGEVVCGRCGRRVLKAIIGTVNAKGWSVSSAVKGATQWLSVLASRGYVVRCGTRLWERQPAYPSKGAEGSPKTTGEVKEALVERGKNYEGARGVPVASVRAETVDIETGMNDKGSPTKRAGSERDEEITGSTERPERGRFGTAEATERHDVTQDWETRTTERQRRVQDADRGATERSKAALKPQGEFEGREKTVEETVCSELSKGALKSTPEDAAETRVNQFSAIIGKVGTGRVNTMIGPGVQNEPEEYDKELEERLIPVDEDKILQRAKRNAKEPEEPTLADMSAVLGIPGMCWNAHGGSHLETWERQSIGWSGTPMRWKRRRKRNARIEISGRSESSKERRYLW
ncbi:hypothetical protein L917_21547 [Phytophthora nicotianae]|uniref:Uncharacterized protein n=1 Tax=Phytophthora nicotianae TaxID=4792 RepID=W2JX59_PHYNI|nr:hypothetical protein L917_21547 [Phytophthora nicotianae]